MAHKGFQLGLEMPALLSGIATGVRSPQRLPKFAKGDGLKCLLC